MVTFRLRRQHTRSEAALVLRVYCSLHTLPKKNTTHSTAAARKKRKISCSDKRGEKYENRQILCGVPLLDTFGKKTFLLYGCRLYVLGTRVCVVLEPRLSSWVRSDGIYLLLGEEEKRSRYEQLGHTISSICCSAIIKNESLSNKLHAEGEKLIYLVHEQGYCMYVVCIFVLHTLNTTSASLFNRQEVQFCVGVRFVGVHFVLSTQRHLAD